MCHINIYIEKNLVIMCSFYFIHWDMKNKCFQISHHCIKTNFKVQRVNVNKTKNYVVTEVTIFVLNLMRLSSTIKTNIAKLKMMKLQWQNIPMKWVRRQRNKTSAFSNFTQIFWADGILEGINFLNSKQKEDCNVAHTLAKRVRKILWA